MERDWPLVGRGEEASLLAEAIADPGCGGAVIAGLAGVGKTRLALAALEEARRHGMTTERVQATRSVRQIPFGALAPLLPPAFEDTGTQLELLQRWTATLGEHAGGARWVLLVDDAHWLDDASAALVQQLAAAGTVFVVATLRSGEPFPDAVSVLWKEGYAERVDLQPLAATDVDRLLAEVLGGPVHPAAPRALWAASEGFPLYLREMVVAAARAHAFRLREGVWVLEGQPSVPPRLAELLDARLASAEAHECRALELVAVAGGCGRELLERLAGAGVVVGLEEKGLVEVQADGRRREVQPIHPLYADLLAARLPTGRAERLTQELARALDGTGARRRGDALRTATWSAESATDDRPELLLRGAREALALCDAPLAERLGTRAWRTGSEEAAVVVAMSLARQARHTEMEDVARTMYEGARDDRVRAELAELRAGNLRRLGRPEDGREVLASESRRLRDPDLRAHLATAGAAMEIFSDGTTTGALRLLEPLLASSSRAYPAAAVLAANALDDAARPRQALELLARAEPAAAAAGLEPGTWRDDDIPPIRAHALVFTGAVHAAQQTAAAAYERALTEHDADAVPVYATVAAMIALWGGRVGTAARVAREGLAVNTREPGREGIGRWLYGLLALAEAWAGRAPQAAQAVAAVAELDALCPTPLSYDPEFVGRGRAWSAIVAGRLSEGRRMLEHAAADARRHERYALELPLLHDIARIGAPGAVRERLAELVAEVDAELAELLLAHVEALCASGGRQIEDAADRLASIGADLLAAEAFATAARRHDDDGLRRRSSACRHRMEALLEACEGARTPALSEAALPDRLTPRELEIATMAARGMQSKEIADTLVVSVRTVDNLLQRAYTKLGVAGRSELRRALVGDD